MFNFTIIKYLLSLYFTNIESAKSVGFNIFNAYFIINSTAPYTLALQGV